MELFFNYIFSIIQPMAKDGWKILSLMALFFLFKNYFNWKKDKIVLSFILFLSYGFLVCLFSPDTITSIKDFLDYFAGWFFPFLIGYTIIDKRNKINLLKVYIFVFAFTIFFGYLAYFKFIPEQIGFYHFIYYEDFRLGVFDLPTIFAARCLFIIIMFLTVLFFIKNKIKFSLLLLVCLYFIGALILSGTRNCYIAAFFVFIIILSFLYIKKKINICIPLILLLLLIAPVFYAYFFNSTINQRVNNTNITKDQSLSDRIKLYKFALELIKEKPIFGYAPKIGINKHIELKHLNVFHNIYLNIIVDFGIIGFILFIYIFYNIFKRLIVLYIKTRSPLPLMLIFAWISILIADNFDCFLKSTFFAGQCFWIIGLVLGGTNDKNS